MLLQVAVHNVAQSLSDVQLVCTSEAAEALYCAVHPKLQASARAGVACENSAKTPIVATSDQQKERTDIDRHIISDFQEK
jgi:hypothetical protein